VIDSTPKATEGLLGLPLSASHPSNCYSVAETLVLAWLAWAVPPTPWSGAGVWLANSLS
jgi:hypothetical protein